MIERMLIDFLYWSLENCVILALMMLLAFQIDSINSKIKAIEKHLGIKVKTKWFFGIKKRTKKDECNFGDKDK